MSEEQDSAEVEEVSLTEEDMAVIDEINAEHSPEEVEETEDISVEETEETSQDISTGSVEESTPAQTIPNDMLQAAQYYGIDPSDFNSQESLGYVNAN